MSTENTDASEALQHYPRIKAILDEYYVPSEHLADILADQKVIHMIRGKALEHQAAKLLQATLGEEWLVDKLNLNPQPGRPDIDIRLTHRRSNRQLSADSKTAVRDSLRRQSRVVSVPHFQVKCHRSRSNTKKETNDRYLVTDFDLLVSNPLNAILKSNHQGPGLPLRETSDDIGWLHGFYGTTGEDDLRAKAANDWRLCFPTDLDQGDGTIPRTPKVAMEDGLDSWFGPGELVTRLDDRLRLG